MTIIEFFDKDHIENVISTLLCDPERVVFIGKDYKKIKHETKRYELVAAAFDRKAEFVVRGLETNDLWKTVETLEDVVQKYDDCIFDLAGGDELALVAAGIVYQRMPERVQLHRFNYDKYTFSDCDADGTVVTQKEVGLDVWSLIHLTGGRIIYEEEKENGTVDWDFTPDFCNDVDVMWRLSNENNRAWNMLITATEEVEDGDPLELHLNIVTYAKQVLGEGKKIPPLFEQLANEGLITMPVAIGYDLSFRCKDEQIKRCLLMAGQVLELKTAMLMDDSGLYDDLRVGVSLDWDEKVGNNDVENEIDVIALRGMIPVFISCKNGIEVSVDELYKLGTVADRFGGKYVKKVLVASRLMGDDFKHRAEEMHIQVIDDVRNMGETSFWHALENIIEV